MFRISISIPIWCGKQLAYSHTKLDGSYNLNFKKEGKTIAFDIVQLIECEMCVCVNCSYVSIPHGLYFPSSFSVHSMNHTELDVLSIFVELQNSIECARFPPSKSLLNEMNE